MEDPQAVKFVVQQGVVNSPNKRALVLQAVGWSVVRQIRLLQRAVQIHQRVRLHPAVTPVTWQDAQHKYILY